MLPRHAVLPFYAAQPKECDTHHEDSPAALPADWLVLCAGCFPTSMHPGPHRTHPFACSTGRKATNYHDWRSIYPSVISYTVPQNTSAKLLSSLTMLRSTSRLCRK